MNRSKIYLRAYELAYLMVPDPRIARSIAKIACGRLDAALDQQYKRTYYRLRKMRVPELRDVDVIDPHGLGMRILDTESALMSHLRNKFLKRDVITALTTFRNSSLERMTLREKLARDLNQAIFFGNLWDYVEYELRHARGSTARSRAPKQILNREIIQNALGRYLATNQHRNVVSLSDLQMLQVLIYAAAEPYELEAEERGPTSYDDLCIRYLKYLAKLSFRSNVFHTSVSYGWLIYDFGRAGSSKIHDFAVQDESRSRPLTNYSNLKDALMRLLEEERFIGAFRLVREKAIDRSTRFKRRQYSSSEASRMLIWLRRLALWSSCLSPFNAKTSLSHDELRQLLSFVGSHPDDEHVIERRRIHAISCPQCLKSLADSAGLSNPHDCLTFPNFETSRDMKNDSDHNARLQPPQLNADDVMEDLKEIDGIRALRRVSTSSTLSLRVNGVECARLNPPKIMSSSFDVKGSADVIEIWGMPQAPESHEVLLAAHLLQFPSDSDQVQILSSNTPVGTLYLEVSQAPHGVTVEILVRTSRLGKDYLPYRTDCVDDSYLRSLVLGQAVTSIAEEQHLETCNECQSRFQRLNIQMHPRLITLLEFSVDRLQEDQRIRVARHLHEGCRKCAAIVRARSFVATALTLKNGSARFREIREFLQYSIDGIDHTPTSSSQYAGSNYQIDPSYFGLFARGDIILTIEETHEFEWLVTVASTSSKLCGRRYTVELLGEEDSFFTEVVLKEEGEYCEGSTYLPSFSPSSSQLRDFTIFGALVSDKTHVEGL